MISAGIVAQEPHEKRTVRPHASGEFKTFAHSSGAYGVEHPSDWQAHERGERTNIGAEDGLVAVEKGFRTIYGVIVQVAADPLAGQPNRSLESSAKQIVDQVLKRNPHQALKEPLASDKPLAGAPAYRAVINGTSPVTGLGERAEIIVRQHGEGQVLYLVLVSPIDHFSSLEAPLRRVRDSLRVPAR
jgi:hypothetical protein